MHLGALGLLSQVSRVTSEQPLAQKTRATATTATSAKAFVVYQGSQPQGLLSMWLGSLARLDGMPPTLDGHIVRLVTATNQTQQAIGCEQFAFVKLNLFLMGIYVSYWAQVLY